MSVMLARLNWEGVTLFLSETIATAILMFVGCLGCVSGELFQPTPLTMSLIFGLTVMIIINIFGMVSGAHLNPAVTIASVVYKMISIPTAIVYVLGQFTGSYFGYALLRVLMGDYGSLKENGKSFCQTLPRVDDKTAFYIEFAITSVLIMVCCGVWDPRNVNNTDSVSLRFGFAVFCLSLVAGNLTGASMNPARSFGPALYNWNWSGHWIYWLAPLSSALLTSLMFRMIFYRGLRRPSLTEEFSLLVNKSTV